MRRSLSFLVGAAALATACAGAPAITTSTVEGHLASTSFKEAPLAVEATNESGAKVRATPAADGSFKFELEKAHTYRLDVVLSSGTEPVVFPRANNKLDRDFKLSTGAATIVLGAITHLDKAPAEGFVIHSSPITGAAPAAGQADGECEDGRDATTGAVCVDDDQETACDAEGIDEDDGGDGECVNGQDATTGADCTDDEGDDDQGEDGECVDGKNTTTGAVCSDDEGDDDQGEDGECVDGKDATGSACTEDEASGDEEADSNAPMAVPEHNAPNDVSGCAEDGEVAD